MGSGIDMPTDKILLSQVTTPIGFYYWYTKPSNQKSTEHYQDTQKILFGIDSAVSWRNPKKNKKITFYF